MSQSPIVREWRNTPLTPMNTQTLRLNEHQVILERGGLRTSSESVYLSTVIDVNTSQSILQKGRHIGAVNVRFNGPNGRGVLMIEDFPEFREIADAINAGAGLARARAMQAQRTTTQNITYSGGIVNATQQLPTPPGPQFQPSAQLAQSQASALPAAPDPFEQLEKLGKLRDAGIISEEDFQAKKSEWLSKM